MVDDALLPVDRLDVLLTFFQNCYALRDWIQNDERAPKTDLDTLMSSSEALRICRDICNGSKHLTISHPSIDADFSIGREYIPCSLVTGLPSPHRWFIVAGTEKHDVLELAGECMKTWELFLEERISREQKRGVK